MNRAELVELLAVERFAPSPTRHPTVAEATPARLANVVFAIWELSMRDNDLTHAGRRRDLGAAVDGVQTPTSGGSDHARGLWRAAAS